MNNIFTNKLSRYDSLPAYLPRSIPAEAYYIYQDMIRSQQMLKLETNHQSPENLYHLHTLG